MVMAALLAGCAGTPGKVPTPRVQAAAVLPEEAPSAILVYDPLERVNRGVYQVNAALDRAVLLPAAELYETVVPGPVRRAIGNFYDHLGDVGNLVNALLQLKGESAAISASRLAWNTTIGVLGLMDPASTLDLPRQDEDLGQTLGAWGLPPGPYLVLPVLGPSSVRDGVGLAGDFELYDAIRVLEPRNLDTAVRSLDTRASIGFRYYQTGSPFEYELVRLLYTKKRELDVRR